MAISSTSWATGQVPNPNGRPVGSKNKITKDFYAAYEESKNRGYKHPLLMMLEIANDPNASLERRDVMLKEAASYLCPKPRQTVAISTDVPVFQSESQAEQFLAEFISAIAPDLEPVELATLTRQFITSKRDGKELELKINPPELQPQHIVIEGGLPTLPGTNIVMPTSPDAHGPLGPLGPAIEVEHSSSFAEPLSSVAQEENPGPTPAPEPPPANDPDAIATHTETGALCPSDTTHPAHPPAECKSFAPSPTTSEPQSPDQQQ